MVVLDFDVVVVAEEFLIPGGDFQGLFHVGLAAGQQRAVQLAGNAAAQANQPFPVGGQQLLVDPRLEIKPLQERRRGELDEVAEAGAVAGQQRQVVAGLLRAAQLFLEAAAGGDVGLQAENRIDRPVPWPSGRTSAPRADCRDPSAPGRSSAGPSPAPAVRESCRPRPTGCNGCGNAGGRREECSSEQPPCVEQQAARSHFILASRAHP